MFERPTVLVIGAGASAEVGFPLGSGLLTQIAEMASSIDQPVLTYENSAIYGALIDHFKPKDKSHFWNKVRPNFSKISRAAQQADSIDEVVRDLADKDLEFVSKVIIAHSISSAERNNTLFGSENGYLQNFDPAKFKNTWYSNFFKILKEGTDKNSLEMISDNVSVINFNYDRTLEEYLYNTISTYYGIEHDSIISIIEKLEVFRPYGAIGRLSWQKGEGPVVPFGQLDETSLSEVAKSIRTINEFNAIFENFSAMRESLGEADRIIFLGCAFHSQNIRLLSCITRPSVEVLATSFGMSKPAKEKAQSVINEVFSTRPLVRFEDDKCHEFMRDRVEYLSV